MYPTDTVRLIRTETEYTEALAAIRPYFENEPDEGTPEADRFDLLALVIKAYEDDRYPMPAADPVAAVRVVMEANSYTRSDLAGLLGGASRASEFLNGRRELSLPQIRSLKRAWRIPADALIGAGV